MREKVPHHLPQKGWPSSKKPLVLFQDTLIHVTFLRHKHLTSSVSANVAIVTRKGMDKSWVNSGPVSQGCMEGSAAKHGRLHIHRAAKRLLSQVGVTESMKRFPMFVGPQLLLAFFLPNRLGP